MRSVTYRDISEKIEDARRPWLDRSTGVIPAALNPRALEWWRDGVVHLPGFMPTALIDEYVKLRRRAPWPGGWSCLVPYIFYRELRDLCLHPPLMEIMHSLIGHPMGVHLNLTGWVSTERALHADDYLNPASVNSHYCAVWVALEDITPESGPFQYVPGSHRWPTIRQHKIFDYLTPEERERPTWPSDTQAWVEAACLREIEERGARFETYLPKKGDVLLWHGCLLHRGSVPTVPGTPRRSLIAHYSSIHHRPDMPLKRKWKDKWMFVIHHPLDPGSPAPTVPVAEKLMAGARRLARRVKGSPPPIRDRLAAIHLRGRGLEIGAQATPLRVPRRARVRYVDNVTREENLRKFPQLDRQATVSPDFVTDGLALSPIASASQDFVIANHVLEHSPDPIAALLHWLRVLRPGGILFVAVPIADLCFDRGRAITSLPHMIDDFEIARDQGADALSRRNRPHYAEWLSISHANIMRDAGKEGFPPHELDGHIDWAHSERSEIHFHTFSPDSYLALLEHVVHLPGAGAAVVETAIAGSEVIAIVRRKGRVQ